MRNQRCIGFGDTENICLNDVDKKFNPYWCPSCDEKRKNHLSKQFSALKFRKP